MLPANQAIQLVTSGAFGLLYYREAPDSLQSRFIGCPRKPPRQSFRAVAGIWNLNSVTPRKTAKPPVSACLLISTESPSKMLSACSGFRQPFFLPSFPLTGGGNFAVTAVVLLRVVDVGGHPAAQPGRRSTHLYARHVHPRQPWKLPWLSASPN